MTIAVELFSINLFADECDPAKFEEYDNKFESVTAEERLKQPVTVYCFEVSFTRSRSPIKRRSHGTFILFEKF